MTKTSNAILILCVLGAGTLAACSSPNADWQKASARGTVAAYRSFIKQHPGDPRVQQARNRIESLKDQHAWRTARRAATEQAYRQYLTDHPNGAFTTQAQSALATLKENAAWQDARSAGTASAYEAFAGEFPNAPQATQAQAEIDRLAGYQIELGRYRTAGAATAAARQLRLRFASVLTAVQVIAPSGAEKLTTLRSQQMSRAAALTACAQLRKARQSCSVVKVQAKAGGLTLSGV